MPQISKEQAALTALVLVGHASLVKPAITTWFV
jgi:hypothetical protein